MAPLLAVSALVAVVLFPPVVGDSTYFVYVPPAVDATEIQRFAEYVHLAEPQRVVWSQFHKAYAEERNQALKEKLPVVDALAAESSAVSAQGMTPRAAFAHEAFLAAEHDLRAHLVKIEDEFLANLETVLATSQQERFQRMRDRRQRLRTWPEARAIRGSRIDLWLLSSEIDISAADREKIDPILAEYETIVTPLVRDANEHLLKARRERYFMIVSMRYDQNGEAVDQTSPDWPARVEAFRREQRRYFGPAARLQVRIAEINEQCAERAALEAPIGGSLLQRAFMNAAYPHVFTDKTYPAAWYERVRDRVAHDAEATENLVALWTEYERKYELKSRDICRQWLAAEEQMAIEHFENASVHRLEADRIKAERSSLAMVFIENVVRLLPTVIQGGLEAEANSLRAELNRAPGRSRAGESR